MTLFTIRTTFGAIEYRSVREALDDSGLRSLMGEGIVASVWSGDLRITRDIVGWGKLQEQLVANASTLLRRRPPRPGEGPHEVSR